MHQCKHYKTDSSVYSSPTPIYRMRFSTEKTNAVITRLTKMAEERAIRAFCINSENTNYPQCIDLAREDAVHAELQQRLQASGAAFVAGCKDTPYTSACVAHVGLPPFWQMLYDFCGWVCGLIWGIGSWLASLGPFTWAVLIIGIILFFACVGAVADDAPRSRRGRGWGPHLD